jgi:eukaryotic-like serine/threonine-protein kinase
MEGGRERDLPVGASETVALAGPSSEPRPVEVSDTLLPVGEDRGFAARYAPVSVLGRGGMGEVRLCVDRRVGREVAVKSLLPDQERYVEARARFLREARVQGQLEHPSIVPVHDITRGDDGTTCFTMKRVRGITLAEVLARHARGDGEVAARHSPRKLLAAFAQVCLTVDFAHSRGVVHRDLKPANIMLGDFGEVYVLDWGLAKLASGDDDRGAGPDSLDLGVTAATATGAILGTPGYMAPEQLLPGGVIGPAADVFALGAILFEILTFERLVPRGDPLVALEVTRGGVDARASVRRPGLDVAPELEEACVRATRLDPAERFASARELNDTIERYLEGDRDLERRRTLAAGHVAAAERLLAEHQAGHLVEEDARGGAMRELGRALALDPGHGDALRAMLRLVAEPPREVPAEVRASLDAASMRMLRMAAQLGGFLMLSWFAFLPMVLWMGVLDPWAVVAVLAPLALASALSFNEARRVHIRLPVQYTVFALTGAAFVAASSLFGPFVLVPTAVATYGVTLQVHPSRRERRIAIGLCCGIILVTGVGEWLGPWSTYAFEDGRMIIEPHLASLRSTPARLLLIGTALAMTLAPCFFIGRIRAALARSEERLAVQSWHLGRLVPRDGGAISRGRPAP